MDQRSRQVSGESVGWGETEEQRFILNSPGGTASTASRGGTTPGGGSPSRTPGPPGKPDRVKPGSHLRVPSTPDHPVGGGPSGSSRPARSSSNDSFSFTEEELPPPDARADEPEPEQQAGFGDGEGRPRRASRKGKFFKEAKAGSGSPRVGEASPEWEQKRTAGAMSRGSGAGSTSLPMLPGNKSVSDGGRSPGGRESVGGSRWTPYGSGSHLSSVFKRPSVLGQPNILPVGEAYREELKRMKRTMMLHEKLIYGKGGRDPSLLLVETPPGSPFSSQQRSRSLSSTQLGSSASSGSWAKENEVLEARIVQLRELFKGSKKPRPPRPLSERMRELARPKASGGGVKESHGIPVWRPPSAKEEAGPGRRSRGHPRLKAAGDSLTGGFFEGRSKGCPSPCNGAMGWVVGFQQWKAAQANEGVSSEGASAKQGAGVLGPDQKDDAGD